MVAIAKTVTCQDDLVRTNWAERVTLLSPVEKVAVRKDDVDRLREFFASAGTRLPGFRNRVIDPADYEIVSSGPAASSPSAFCAHVLTEPSQFHAVLQGS